MNASGIVRASWVLAVAFFVAGTAVRMREVKTP